MKQRISSFEYEKYIIGMYFIVFFGIFIIGGIIYGIIKNEVYLITTFSITLIFLILFFLLNRYLLKYLRRSFIDDKYLYISNADKPEEKIPLNNVISVSYISFPLFLIRMERWIKIEYLTQYNSINKIIIIPSILTNENQITWNRNILDLIKNKIEDCPTV